MKISKILVTGGAGFIGSNIVDRCISEGHEVVVIDNLSAGKNENLNLKAKFYNEDIRHFSMKGIFEKEKPDYFINFAANSFVGNSWTMPVNHMMTNCMAVLYQLEAIRKFAPHCRYYNAGSSEEWGDVDYSPQDEKHPAKPRSPYGASKVAARQLVKVWRESYNLYAVQGWLLNHEGIRRGEEFITRKISKNVARIVCARDIGEKFEPMELGNLEAKRDWSDAADFVRGVWLMMNQDFPKDYVLSSNETHSVREGVVLAFKAAMMEGEWRGEGLDEVFVDKKSEKVLVKINPKFYRPAEVELLLGDSTLARKELEWEPKTSFNQLVEKMVAHDLGWPY
jgi:GDPmannose 4,6-dehydratase